jgi:hypothetical protein
MRLFEFANPRAPLPVPPESACAAGKHYCATSADKYLGHARDKFDLSIATLIASLLRPADRILGVGVSCTSAPVSGDFDFIKIDIENFGRGGLEALEPTIARCRPVVVLDVNHWRLDQSQRTQVPDFLASLRRLFPLLYAVDGASLHDLHDADGACYVMYSHVAVNMRYPLLLGAFKRSRLPPPKKQAKKKTGRTLSSLSNNRLIT